LAAPSPASRQHGQRNGTVRLRRGQINNVRKGNAGNTPASRNEGVGEHVRTRFHFDREATREIAEPENRSRTERRKLVSSAGPGFSERTREENDPTVDLMSRRHPLSSTRTF
jgi:hypothetical protein